MRALFLLQWLAVSGASLIPEQLPLVPISSRIDQHDKILYPNTRNALLDLHRNLVEFESITGNERDVGRWLASYLKAHNFTVELQEVESRRYNVLAYPGSKRETEILITSHIDTVPPYWPYEVKAHSTEIWGRGSVDAKACVAAQTIAVLDLLQSSKHQIPEGSLSLLFVVGEEVDGYGMRFFSDHKPTNYSAVIFGEPTEGKLASGHKGSFTFFVKVKGKAAHSGYPWLGISANTVIVEALSKLIELESALPSSEKLGNSTLNIGLIDGGVAANVVAEYAEAKVAIRVAAGTPNEIKSLVAEALAETKNKAESNGGSLEIELIGRPFGPVDIDSDVKGFDTITVNYGTDIPNLVGDHKRYLYGPGSILVAHSDHEHLKVSELELAAKDYQKLILATLGYE